MMSCMHFSAKRGWTLSHPALPPQMTPLVSSTARRTEKSVRLLRRERIPKNGTDICFSSFATSGSMSANA